MHADASLEAELRQLLAETNDQRRRFGQALYHFYRTLVFWGERGASFAEATRMWAAGGAAIFDGMAASLRALVPHQQDATLRTFAAGFTQRLGEDLARGPHMRVSFLRWLETRFPALTKMMRAEDEDTRIFDYALAFELAGLFARIARATDSELPPLLAAGTTVLRPED